MVVGPSNEFARWRGCIPDSSSSDIKLAIRLIGVVMDHWLCCRDVVDVVMLF
jgi:hypothetical protein